MPTELPASRPTEKPSERKLSRRQFIQGLSALCAGSLLAGCAPSQQRTGQAIAPGATPTPALVMASPEPPGPEDAPASQEGDFSLDRFLALSAALTGFANLNPVLGQVYLQSLQNAGTEVSLAELYEQSGLEGTAGLQEVDQAIFEQESTRALADKLIEYWYTGVYEQDGEQVVATTTEALAWQALDFTKPLTICGPYSGFWAERPTVGPAPAVTEASLVQEETSDAN
jgi:hypothetical protein